MSAVDALITAMHQAGASVARTTGDWLELTQSHVTLLEAMRKVFGKRLPTPQKLGLWLSSHLGQCADDLILQGQHSARRKAWSYRIDSKTKIAEELAARARMAAAAAPHAPTVRVVASLPAPGEFTPLKDKPCPEYESKQVVDRATGAIKRELLTGRDGQPITAARSQPAGSMLTGGKIIGAKHEFRDGAYWTVEDWRLPDGRVVENWVAPAGTTHGRSWQPAGANGRPTRAQLAARHHQREESANVPRSPTPGLPMHGVAGPAGVRVDTSGSESWMYRLHLKDF